MFVINELHRLFKAKGYTRQIDGLLLIVPAFGLLNHQRPLIICAQNISTQEIQLLCQSPLKHRP
jgi:hypothetical protein